MWLSINGTKIFRLGERHGHTFGCKCDALNRMLAVRPDRVFNALCRWQPCPSVFANYIIPLSSTKSETGSIDNRRICDSSGNPSACIYNRIDTRDRIFGSIPDYLGSVFLCLYCRCRSRVGFTCLLHRQEVRLDPVVVNVDHRVRYRSAGLPQHPMAASGFLACYDTVRGGDWFISAWGAWRLFWIYLLAHLVARAPAHRVFGNYIIP